MYTENKFRWSYIETRRSRRVMHCNSSVNAGSLTEMSAGGEGNAAKANPQSVEQQKPSQRPNGDFYRLSTA